MSILFKNETRCVLDHKEYIDRLYEKVVISHEEHISYKFPDKFFSIINKKIEENRKRSRRRSNDIVNEVTTVKSMYRKLLEEVPNKLKEVLSKYDVLDTSSVRDASRNLFEATIFEHSGIHGGNDSENALRCTIKGEQFLIPPRARFFCGDVNEQCQKLSGDKFNIIIADPPWWNKYIRRLKGANNKLSYSMMYNEDIASIPIKGILSQNCIVAVWCTNSPSNITAVKDIIFPQWGVEYCTTWYWLKATTSLEPMCPFGVGSQKQPYERIMLGRIGDVDVPTDQLVLSIPSALHSHKPPIIDLLSPLLKEENPRILELFARYLLPDTTSIGYEPLKWQHISVYEQVVNE